MAKWRKRWEQDGFRRHDEDILQKTLAFAYRQEYDQDGTPKDCRLELGFCCKT